MAKKKTTTTVEQDHRAEVLEFLPAEAHEAMRTGGNWDGMPDSAGDCSDWYSQDDGEWISRWHPSGYVVENGKLYFRVMDVDSDGGWEFNDEAEVGSPEEAWLEKAFSFEEWQKTYHEYLRWVAEHGEDPMGEFMFSATISHEEKWRAECVETAVGVELLRARPAGADGWWIRPEKLPPEIISYMGAEKNADGKWSMRDYARLADLKAVIAGSADLKLCRAAKGIGIDFSLKIARPNPKYRAQLREAARQGLKPVKKVKA